MPHDCTPSSCGRKNYRMLHGKRCVGYMDYDFTTHGWSYCNYYDTKTNLARRNCLQPRDGGENEGNFHAKAKSAFDFYDISSNIPYR